MNFKGFLRSLRAKKNFASARELFEKLGAEQKLGMSLRNFQFVESGTNLPSTKFLGHLMLQVPRDEYRNSILAFFGSHFEDDPSHPILAYLEQYLAPALDVSQESIFDAPDRTVMMYSDEQLKLLSQNTNAMRLHHRLLLWEKIEADQLHGREAAAEELLRLNLAERGENGSLLTSREIFQVPNYENSPPVAVLRSTQYLSAVRDAYVSSEGAPDQELSFALQLVTPSIARIALEQMLALKNWLHKMASPETKPGLVPFVFVSFGKRLSPKEL